MRLLAVRANERAAASLGISVTGMKLLSFAIGGLLAGAAGGLIEAQFFVGDFSQFTVSSSISVVLNGLVGGIGWVSGAALAGGSADAGVVSQLLSNWFSPSNWLDPVLGASVLLVVVFQPDGVAPFNIEAFQRLRARLRPATSAGPRRPSAAATVTSGFRKQEPVRIERGCVSPLRQPVALDHVSVTVASGEIVGLIGSNGAGS